MTAAAPLRAIIARMRTAERAGFSLVEVVIAAFVFAIGALALEATAVGALRRMRRSADLTLAADVARSRLELLASSRCAALSDGSETIRSVQSSWAVSPTGSTSVRIVTHTISYTLDGVSRTQVFRTAVSCSA